MLAKIIGDVDQYSAAVLVSIFSMLTIVGAIWLAKRRSRLEIDNDFALAKIKQANENTYSLQKLDNAHAEVQFKLETERGFKFKQVEAGLITSHKSNHHKRGDEQED